MGFSDELVRGQALTWTGPPCADPVVLPGERGVFVDYDGREADDGYVVDFPEGRSFCCRRTDVTPDPQPVRGTRRRKS
jgi:hypothetical protein